MLPKRKLNMSIVKPPEIPIITNPTAIPDDKRTATDASPEMLNLSLIRVMINALTKDTPYAVQSGYTPAIRPKAIPPKDECAIASPNKEYRLKTRNSPTTEHKIAIDTPEMSALCIKPNERISRVMINGDAYAPALRPLNIVLLVRHFQKSHLTHHERIKFCLDMQRDLQVC